VSDHYETLGVERGAPPEEIKRAYRKLARELHPDANPDDPASEERFKEVTRAYEVLSDPAKRERYDTFGDDRAGASGFSDFHGISDLFASFFGGTTPGRRRSARGADILAEVEISLEEAATGVDREVTLRTLAECEACSGSGAAPGTFPSPCSDCGGSGELRQVRRTMLGDMITAATCARCGGRGEEIASPCQTCHGDGRIQVESSITVSIPPGIDDGTRLRVTGRGQAGMRGAGAGDLYVEIGVAEHPVWRRAGDDLGCEVLVPFTVAALGGTAEIPTLDGPEEIDIKPGTQSGEVVNLRGKGMPSLRGGRRGDLVGLLRVEVPTDLDDQQRDLIKALADAREEHVGRRSVFDKIKESFR
jgi:molecular chaperone DnaJ